MDIKKILIVLMVIFIMLVMFELNNVQAALQSNGNTSATYNIDEWLLKIRQMENLGGAFGLTETLSEDLTSGNTSNNIDVHMQKNTEYGAMVILSASSYGNPNKINDGDTTTGNETGAIINFNKEWVAACSDNNLNTANWSVSAARYRNVYPSYEGKPGDAMIETDNWHGSNTNVWFSYFVYNLAGMLRSYSNSVFSYYGFGQNGNGTRFDAYYENNWSSRAVAVIGEGF